MRYFILFVVFISILNYKSKEHASNHSEEQLHSGYNYDAKYGDSVSGYNSSYSNYEPDEDVDGLNNVELVIDDSVSNYQPDNGMRIGGVPDKEVQTDW